jgi:HK97 family phage prohead protease
MTFQKPTGREVRVATEAWPLEDVEVRADGDGLTFRGYAAVFNSWSEDLGGFRERIQPGAFTKTIKERRSIKMFHNHNSDIVLASTKAKTLTLTEDARGLHAEAQLPDNYWGAYVRDAVKRGDIDSMSFGFQTVKDTWSADLAERDLIEARLFEVSDVSGWPAYAATSASVRELAEIVDEDPDELAEAFKLLREPEARLSTSQASLLTKLINARTDQPLRRVFTSEEAGIYAAFEAALS